MTSSDNNKSNFGLPDMTALSEAERLQVLAVMQRAKEFERNEEAKTMKSFRPLEGQLTKFTNVMKGWQHRWFILDPESGMLEYFEKEEHKKMRPRGSVHLAGAVINPSEEDSQTFIVSAVNGEIYRLRAVDAKERQQWVDRLRVTSQHHTEYMSQRRKYTSHSPQSSQREVRSQSLVASSSSSSVIPSKQQNVQRKYNGSTENIHSAHNNQQIVPRVSPTPQISVTKAPAPHPHTLDPFQEVKEYMLEAEDYSHFLNDKVNSLPHSGEAITGLDKDLLLMKATSAATLACLGQCLTMLQQRQEAYGDIHGHHVSSPIEVKPILMINNRTQSITESVPSSCGSFTSTHSLTFPFPAAETGGPINHEDEVEDEKEYKDSDLEGMEEHKSIILHLLSQLKLGMDLTKVVLPTFILERRSLLELFADCMAHPDVFLRITKLAEPEDRMLAVLEWYLTSFHAGRQGSVAKKPYNPIIGETFHCSWKIPPEPSGENGDSDRKPHLMTYCAEQVSHHPPVSAFYFECPDKNVCLNASIYTKSKFMGMSIGVVMVGKLTLRLLDYDEEYVFGLPSAYARSILTTPWAEMGDRITMTCQKTNYSAAVMFHTKPFYGGKLHRVSAEVKNGTTGNIVCKVQGEWNSAMEFTFSDEQKKVIDVNNMKIWHKRVRPVEMQGEFESRKLWQHVTNALKVGDVNTATEHKKFLEERQREGERHRKDTGTEFPTQFFKKVGDTWTYKNMLQKSK